MLLLFFFFFCWQNCFFCRQQKINSAVRNNESLLVNTFQQVKKIQGTSPPPKLKKKNLCAFTNQPKTKKNKKLAPFSLFGSLSLSVYRFIRPHNYKDKAPTINAANKLKENVAMFPGHTIISTSVPLSERSE